MFPKTTHLHRKTQIQKDTDKAVYGLDTCKAQFLGCYVRKSHGTYSQAKSTVLKAKPSKEREVGKTLLVLVWKKIGYKNLGAKRGQMNIAIRLGNRPIENI